MAWDRALIRKADSPVQANQSAHEQLQPLGSAARNGEGRADLMHYDLQGHMPYRGAITEQYRKLGALPGVKYGKTPQQPAAKAADIHVSPL